MPDPDLMSPSPSLQASPLSLSSSAIQLSLQALGLPPAPYVSFPPDIHKPPPTLQCKDPKAIITTLTAPTHTSLMTITPTNQTELALALDPTPLTRCTQPNRRQLAAELFPEKTPTENVEELMAWVVATFCSGDGDVVYECLADNIHADDPNQDQSRAGQKRSRPLSWERERERDGGERAGRSRRRSHRGDARRGEANGYEYHQQQQQQQEQHRRYTIAGQDGYDEYHYYEYHRRGTVNGYKDGRQYDRYYSGNVNHRGGHRYYRQNTDSGDYYHRHDNRSGANREDTRPKANFRSEAIDTTKTHYNIDTINTQPQQATTTTPSIPAAAANTTAILPQETPTTTPSYSIPAPAADNTILHCIPTTHQEEHPISRNARTKIIYRQRNSYRDFQYQRRHRSSNSTVPDLYPPVMTRSGAYARPEEYEASRGYNEEGGGVGCEYSVRGV